MTYPRWMDPDTNYTLERSGTPVTEDGYKIGQHTGHVICEECYRSADHIEEIQHGPNCDNVGDGEQLEASD